MYITISRVVASIMVIAWILTIGCFTSHQTGWGTIFLLYALGFTLIGFSVTEEQLERAVKSTRS